MRRDRGRHRPESPVTTFEKILTRCIESMFSASCRRSQSAWT